MQTFSRPPGFMGPPIATDYPAYDRRVTDAANDTDEEQGERSILDRIAQVMASLGGAGPGVSVIAWSRSVSVFRMS
jgi:hypothetical protein